MQTGNGLKDRVFQVFLLVIVFNIIAFVLLWQLDLFVHTELYNYGLEFSFEWAANYWYNNGMGWALLGGATILALLSFIPHHIYNHEHSRFSRFVGFLLSTLAIIYQVLSIYFLWQVSNIVQTNLYNFGLIPHYNWISIIKDLNSTILITMFIGLGALIIPSTRNWEIFASNAKKIKTKKLDQFLK